MKTIDSDQLIAWGITVLVGAGLTEADAASVSRNLAYADLRGTSSHGFTRLANYLRRIAEGGINKDPRPSVVRDLGGLAVLDADAGPGAASATLAASMATQRAREHGIGCIIVRNSNHFGATSHYAEMIADEGMVGIVLCNTDRAVSVPGGGRAVMGTNPLAIALPLAADARPILDMATSEVAYGRILLAAGSGAPLGEGWAVDSTGSPTTDADAALEGALLPAGGPKGFGLAFMIDALVALGGARTSPFVSPLNGDPGVPQELGQVIIAIDNPTRDGAFERDVESLISEVRSSELPRGGSAMFPGEPELKRSLANAGRISISAELEASLDDVARDHGVELPSALVVSR